MLSSQHRAMIETGITVVLKKEPTLTSDGRALCVCPSGRRQHFMHEQYVNMCLFY